MELITLACLLAASVVGHCAQLHFYRRTKSALLAAEEARKKRPLSVEAGELLQDLATQGAILRLERIDPEHLFMWRPR